MPMPKPIEVSALRKLIQKYNPIPINGAVVRYDQNVGKWAIVDSNKKPTQHFDMAIMKDVSFHSETKREGGGCGGPTILKVGYATGSLYLHKTSDQFTAAGRNGGNAQFSSLSFKGDHFVNQSGEIVSSTKELVLMPQRHAYYLNQ